VEAIKLDRRIELEGDFYRLRNHTGKASEDKKIGAESSDPNRHSQPRLPGSVVGEASMRRTRFPYKITEVTAQKLLSVLHALGTRY